MVTLIISDFIPPNKMINEQLFKNKTSLWKPYDGHMYGESNCRYLRVYLEMAWDQTENFRVLQQWDNSLIPYYTVVLLKTILQSRK